MKPTLYEALGLSRTASEAEVKAALRRLVRRYYTRTRSGNADVEEALRFLNHASHILGNAARRAEYDANLIETARAASSMTTIGGTFQAEVILPGDTEVGESISQLGLPRDRPPPPPELAPELSSKLADIRRTPAGRLSALIGTAVLFVATWIFAVPRGETWSVVGFTIAMLLAGVIVAAGVAGIVHLLSRSLWRLPAPENALSLVEGMIPRWRKDRTVFLGTGAPVEDATWLFRLRMAELKRVKAERVSDPRPVMRLLARLFDYAMWGLACVAVFGGLTAANVMPAAVADAALHPLVAPILVSLTWVPVEALLLAQLQTTPGRWLLCVYLQHGVSNPYAPEELRFTFATAAGRAFEVWWRGCAAWLPGIALVALARARERVKRSGETRWDSHRDCLVTHGPVGRLSLVTLALGLLAGALAYAAHWRGPVLAVGSGLSRTVSTITTPAPAPSETKLAPILSVPQSRISRLDDASDDVPAASGTSAPAGAAGPAAGSAPSATGTSRDTVPPPAAELSPSVASNRAMAIENSQPTAVQRSDEPPAAGTSPSLATAPSPAAGAAPPVAPAPVRTPVAPATPAASPASSGAAPPSATPASSGAAPPSATPSVQSVEARAPSAAPPSAAPPSTSSSTAGAPAPATSEPASTPSSSFSPKTFLANLFKKPQPVEPPAPPQPEPEKGPTPAELRERRSTEYLRQAQRQQTAGDYAGLIRTCTRWSEDDWKSARAHYCLGLGLQGTGQHKQAITAFNKAGSLLPRDDPLKTQINEAVVRSFRAQTGGGR